MSRPDFFNALAQNLGAPAGWQWRKLEALGDEPAAERDRARQFSQMTGYVHSGATFKSGPRKGQQKPNSPARGTERTYVFRMSEIDALAAAWELETGLCSRCEDGRFGTSTCPGCNGTGKAARR